jgi:hypothetical protein
LAGARLLLPLDLLAVSGRYLPARPEYRAIRPHNRALSDLVETDEFFRRFAAVELRAGRWPLWDPYCYAGAPFLHYHLYSPFNLPYYLFPTPVTLAWVQLMKSLLAGAGAYLFFRRVLRVGFWPAAFGAWCLPLTGFFVLWQGYPLSSVTAWLPWLLLATDAAVRRPRGWGGPALAVLTGLTLVSGHLDIAGQVLLVSGLFALWCWADEYRGRRLTRPALGGLAAAVAGWGLGFLLAAPFWVPMLDYARTGARMARRQAGAEERPPGQAWALAQVVLPDVYGTDREGSCYLGPGNQLESPAQGYTGLLAALLLAPLAWCSPRHRSLVLFCAALALLGLSWSANVPGLVAVWRLPGLRMLSHNRFVFATSFAVLTLAVVGLEVVGGAFPGPRRWFWLPVAVLVALGGWCLYRAAWPPEPVASELADRVRNGRPRRDVPDLDAVRRVQDTFLRTSLGGAGMCALACGGWLALLVRAWPRPRTAPVLGALAVGELLVSAYGVSPQCDPALYYPPVPVLAQLAAAPPGRVLAVNCLPAMLNEVYGLRDVRGYDGVDPRWLVELLETVRDPADRPLPYARTQFYLPQFPPPPGDGTARLPGVLDMLGVRYLIFQGTPRQNVRPLLREDGYFVVENKGALPRAYVPARVESVANDQMALKLLGAATFDPRRVAFVVGSLSLPPDCRGTAEVHEEGPARVVVTADMQTPGLLVLADQWSDGWKAYLDGRPVPVLRANHALRGVELPAGRWTVVFRYEPESLRLGLWALAAGLAGLLLWAGWRGAASGWFRSPTRRR